MDEARFSAKRHDPSTAAARAQREGFFLERDGAVTVTLPPDRVVAAQIEPALVAA
jgi:hypothetical protein